MEKNYFGVVDIILFVGLSALSLLVGAYYAFKDRKDNNKDNYYFAKGSMSPIPVGLSISVTFVSSVTMVGYPTESYGYGTIILWYSASGIIPVIMACVYYIPLIHRLQLWSIYEYLERRFHKRIRSLESVITIFTQVLFLGPTMYLPALVFNALTPISLTLAILSTSAVCILYTALGGMKAVVWTDTLQTFVMLVGVISACIKATVDVGGATNVVEALQRGQRHTFWNFNPDPTRPYSFWTVIVGLGVSWCSVLCINQSISQRYLSCKSVRHARMYGALLVSYIPTFVFFFLSAIMGLVMYAYFEGCDPLKAGQISKPDQMIPLLVIKVFQTVPGMAGVFASAVISGALSTISSGINSVGALILEDFILKKWPDIKPALQVTISKLIVAGFGILTMAYAFAIQYISATIMQLGFIISGSLFGPMTAIFTLGLFLPWCNTKGAIAGQIVGTAFQSWVAVSALVYGPPLEKYSFLPTTTDRCVAASSLNTTEQYITQESFFTTIETTETIRRTSTRPVIQDTLFALSPLYHAALSFVVTILVAMAVSLATGMNKPKEMDPDLFVPILEHPCLPQKVRTFFRFGVPERKKKIPKDEEDRSPATDLGSEAVANTSVL